MRMGLLFEVIKNVVMVAQPCEFTEKQNNELHILNR